MDTPDTQPYQQVAHQQPEASEQRPAVERLPYSPPTLSPYGRIDEITATVGTRGRRDGRGGRGGGRRRRTGF